MAKYRKRPVVVEAAQYLAGQAWPAGVCDCSEIGFPEFNDGRWVFKPHVHTIHHGQAVVLQSGDWVLPESDGRHFYPCKPDIFAATYEEVPDA